MSRRGRLRAHASNGIGNWETLAKRLGVGRVLAGSTYNSGAIWDPDRPLTPISDQGDRRPNIGTRPRHRSSLQIRRLSVEVSSNIQGHIWSKFVHNCAINPVSAVTVLRPGEIARTATAAALLDRLLDEILAVVAGDRCRCSRAPVPCEGRPAQPSQTRRCVAKDGSLECDHRGETRRTAWLDPVSATHHRRSSDANRISRRNYRSAPLSTPFSTASTHSGHLEVFRFLGL